MDDPVLVDVFRGSVVESRHRAAVAVSDADGRLVLALGDVARPVFPRSAVKIVQALPLVESGAADDYGFGDAELALAAASHNGEPRQVETALSMLAKAGRTESALECGTQWPRRPKDAAALNKAGLQAGPIHNNCSGKHAGFVCLACHEGLDPAGYVEPEHAVQRAVKAAMEDVFGLALAADMCGTDGCSIPTYAIPLDRLARGMAKLATGSGLGPARAAAARRIMDATMAEPFMVAGTGRFCTDFMIALGTRVFAKTGAEGVFCGAIPGMGLGIAIKCEDGAARAAEVIMAKVVAVLLGAEVEDRLRGFVEPPISNWNGRGVGRLAPSAVLEAAVKY